MVRAPASPCAADGVETDLRRDAEMPQVPRLRAARGRTWSSGPASACAQAGVRRLAPPARGACRPGSTSKRVEDRVVRAVEHARLLDRRGPGGRAWPRSRRTGRRDRASARTLPARRRAAVTGARAHAASRPARPPRSDAGLPGELVGRGRAGSPRRGMRANRRVDRRSSAAAERSQHRARRLAGFGDAFGGGSGCSRPRRSASRVAVYRSASSRSFHAFHSLGVVPAMSAQVSRYR